MTSNALVIHPYSTTGKQLRTPVAALKEAVGLAQAIDLQIVYAEAVPLKKRHPATLIGRGKIAELKDIVHEHSAELVIINHTLSPTQQRNIEQDIKCKAIDRTALILEIFGKRARTREGQLQVELAAMEYQKSRLVRSWTHLERQRGGAGFMGGPGEKQIETDRRIIRERIATIKKQLADVVRTRELHRKQRRDVPYPIVALTGYTNAGKSTLFNRLTQAKVMAQDQLFATLDPTIRALTLPSGLTILLSDTVGFISDLPTELIAAFRATLEEVVSADLILHIRDGAHSDTDAQKVDVEDVLASLFKDKKMPPLVEVCNKADLAPFLQKDSIINTSALTGEGADILLKTIDATLRAYLFIKNTVELELSNGKAIAWLHAHGHVENEYYVDNKVIITAQLSDTNWAKWGKEFGK